MATERRYFGKVERVNTRPPSLTIIPEDLTIRPGYDVALGLSHTELADFLYTFATGQMRVSYVVQPGPAGVMLVQDVQSVEAVEVKEEPGSSGAAGGPGEVMMGEESGGPSQAGSRAEPITLEEEARRNAKGIFVGGSDLHTGDC